jgi:hypothetical protein
MKKVLCLIAILALAGVASAQGPGSKPGPNTLAPIKERLGAVKEIKRDMKGAFATSTRANLQEKVMTRAGNLLGKVASSTPRLEGFLAKVKTRLTEMSAAGKDTKAAEAKTSLATAQDELSKLSTTGTTTRATWQASKTLVAKALVDLKQAHAKIVEVIRAINK